MSFTKMQPKNVNFFLLQKLKALMSCVTIKIRLILAIFHNLILSQISPGLQLSAVYVFWKHCGKRRNCLLQAISPFPTLFSTRLENFLPLSSNLKLLSANSFNLEESKIYRLGKG